MIRSLNPATGEVLAEFAPLSEDELDRRLDRAVRGLELNRRRSVAERAVRMRRAADILEGEQRELGRLMTLEMGKPIASAAQEAAKCALACRYFAGHAETFLRDEPVATEALASFVTHPPVGIVLAVMPWNFPFWQVFRFAAPALMAGNAALLKHASNVPQCAAAIEDVLRRAGFDGDEFQQLRIGSGQVPRVIRDGRVAAVTLTGSEPAGSTVAADAARVIKKSVLELGGSDPFLVMPSANLDRAVTTAVSARIVNSGESCIAAKRFIVHERIADEFERRFVGLMERVVVGDPMDERTQVGPLATADILEELAGQVRRTVEQGARVLTGGRRLDRPGNFYAPTVLRDVPETSPAATEELFGPVAPIFRVSGAEDAVRLANATRFGLGASAWTNDPAERDLFVSELAAGQVFLNAMVVSDPRLPFGGVKRSGYGRELGRWGFMEWVVEKTVVEGN